MWVVILLFPLEEKGEKMCWGKNSILKSLKNNNATSELMTREAPGESDWVAKVGVLSVLPISPGSSPCPGFPSAAMSGEGVQDSHFLFLSLAFPFQESSPA